MSNRIKEYDKYEERSAINLLRHVEQVSGIKLMDLFNRPKPTQLRDVVGEFRRRLAEKGIEL